MTRLSFSKQVSINSVQESKQLSTLVNTCSKYNQVPSLYFWLTLLIHCIYLRYDSCIEFRHMYFFASQLCSDNGSFVIFSHPFSPLVSSLCALCDVPCTNLLFKWKQKTLIFFSPSFFKTTIIAIRLNVDYSLIVCENDDCFNESWIWKHFVICAIKSQFFFVFLCVCVHRGAFVCLFPPSFLPFLCPSSMWRCPSRLLGRAVDPNVSGLQPHQQHAVVRWKVRKPSAV